MARPVWNEEKNDYLKRTRGVCFEEVVSLIESGKLLDIIDNPSSKHKSQQIYVVEIRGYVYAVPFLKNENVIELKTIIPSRKLMKMYRTKGGKNE
ncbi:MAG: uncharacterized DUF497 family protein [Candidatus Omnitrophota bacterium]|jgi:uncharacterized DUF497 family protein